MIIKYENIGPILSPWSMEIIKIDLFKFCDFEIFWVRVESGIAGSISPDL